MAKPKGKKGGKGGKKKKKEENTNLITEVDKTFYELQITDLNRKLARLRSLTTELEEKNEELQTTNDKLDEDRADIIAYLKRSLQEKADEINDLQERLKGLQEKRQAEIDEFHEKLEELQNEYETMKDQLTSEIKLLTGKLNSLEEFRIQRDELMKKYEIQEAAMREQEIRHKREVYDIEKKFIIGKDKLKKDMETRLLQLSTEFQDATNLRIAATTHRVIRENIAINNELDVILETHHRLQKDNEQLRQHDKVMKMETDLHDTEKRKALQKSQVQYKLIEKLTIEHEKLNRKLESYKDMDIRLIEQARLLKISNQNIDLFNHKTRILEQNLHASRCDRSAMKTELDHQKEETERLTDILVEAVMSIEDALDLTENAEESAKISKRETLLTNLLALMSKVHEQKNRKPSLDTIESCSAMYVKGDLGFVPKPVVLRSQIPTKRNMESQVGSSFEDFLSCRSETLADRLRDFIGEEEASIGGEQSSSTLIEEEEVLEEESRVFFDDEPEPPSDTTEEAAAEIDLTTGDFPKKGRKQKEGDEYSTVTESSAEVSEVPTEPTTVISAEEIKESLDEVDDGDEEECGGVE